MVNSISSVRFCGPADTSAAAAANKPENTGFFDRPGAFAKPADNKPAQNDPAAKPKKKSSFGKKLLATVGVLVAVAAALVAGNKAKVLTVLTDAEKANAGWFKKAVNYVAVAGEWLAKNTYDPIAKLFSKKPAA